MKAFFFSRHLREKMLLTALLALVALTWLTRVARGGREFWRDWRATATTLATQQQWLDHRADIEAAATRAVAHLDPSRTFSSARLLGELSTIADQVGVRSNTASEILGTERTSEFAVNTVQFAIRNADLAAILRLCGGLDQRAPYLGLEQFSLTVNPANPALLNVTLRVSSVEIAR
ncbi:MAG: general secretion pathway protein GspM [Opitutaceae bacterium]|nr:general secretion pathway protein GspM [Opitutaceae bacterium]